MQKPLNELSKDELIDIIQDYQEMVMDIESIINKECCDAFVKKHECSKSILQIRETMSRYL